MLRFSRLFENISTPSAPFSHAPYLYLYLYFCRCRCLRLCSSVVVFLDVTSRREGATRSAVITDRLVCLNGN